MIVNLSENFLTAASILAFCVIPTVKVTRYRGSLLRSSLGSPHNLGGKRSVSETTMPGESLSAPLGFVGT